MVRPRNVNRTKADTNIPDWEQEEFGSRTQIKKAAQAVTDLGEKLAEMTESEIKKMQLPAEFEQAILMLKTMDKGPAIKRQKLFVGKLLRQNEDLIIEIKEKLAEKEARAKQQNAHFQKLEKWRDRLIEEGDEALSEFTEHYPQVDRQQLRQWIRNAQKEQNENKPPKSARLLFKYLRGLEW
ncbi:MAG: ribosome biogenesis factor YjgA [Thiomicrorhabdus chilensis]|uniref:ribosome biogenesis factor YjgA n=1 Tax=Thiomicrorhabdus chilensis TaxID=63656 RepID=UPI00041A41B1|nr:ribosome biogenesis factor YjgA [Thiomicrorhabdus chilensis]MDX1348206.1 ribosome biogenesis factor YjgA [Thiomicrorhabdus chilensis]